MSGARIFGLRALGWVVTVAMATGALAGCDTNPSPNGGPTGPLAAPGTIGAPALPAAVQVALENGYMRIPNAVHPFAVPENDAGRLDPERRIENLSLFFKPSPISKAQMDALAIAQLDPKSPEYHQWLTPERYAARFGAAARGHRARDRLARGSRGSRCTGRRASARASRSRARCRPRGGLPDGDAPRTSCGGEPHYAMATAPAIPADLADVVLGALQRARLLPKARHRHRELARRQDHEGPGCERARRRRAGRPRRGLRGARAARLGRRLRRRQALQPGHRPARSSTARGSPSASSGRRRSRRATSTPSARRSASRRRTVTMTLVPDTGAAAAGKLRRRGRGDPRRGVVGRHREGRDRQLRLRRRRRPQRRRRDVLPHRGEPHARSSARATAAARPGSLPTDADVAGGERHRGEPHGHHVHGRGRRRRRRRLRRAGLSGLYVDLPGRSRASPPSAGRSSQPVLEQRRATSRLTPRSSRCGTSRTTRTRSTWGRHRHRRGRRRHQLRLRPARVPERARDCSPNGLLPAPRGEPMRQVPDVALSAASGTPGYYIECTFDNATAGLLGHGRHAHRHPHRRDVGVVAVVRRASSPS